MKNFIISTDTTADLPESMVKEFEVQLLSLTCTMDGVTYDMDNPLPLDEFYAKVRGGAMPVTSQVNPEIAKEQFNKMIDKYDMDVLHLAFSSGLSGSYASARLAAEEIAEERTDHKVIVVDTLAAALGEGLFVYKCLKLREEGKSLEEVAAWAEDNKLHLVHNFTVDDLNHLYRGGRVSKSTAVLGTALNIKPVLHVDDEGHLINVDKVRGRKKSLIALVDAMEKQMGSYRDQNDIAFIGHGDCLEDAQFVASLIKERFGIDCMIGYIGFVIGTHSGPGTVALFYMGEYR